MPTLTPSPTAVYDARDHSWWGLPEPDRDRFVEWLTGQGYEYNGKTVRRVEVYEGDSPTARVFAFRLDEQGRKHIDPETGDVAMEPPHDLVLSSLPPVQPGRA